jgi:hypothetical protein
MSHKFQSVSKRNTPSLRCTEIKYVYPQERFQCILPKFLLSKPYHNRYPLDAASPKVMGYHNVLLIIHGGLN